MRRVCRKPGAIWMGQSGDVACDYYHRWRDDLKLMRDLGIKAYRFSIGWPRVLPEGVGKVNQKGMDYYSAVVDRLWAYGIEPWVTLFHWDYPLAFYHRGGWLNRESADWFAEYAGVVAKGLGDRVGLVYTDYPTQRRVAKDSAYWNREVVGSDGEGL